MPCLVPGHSLGHSRLFVEVWPCHWPHTPSGGAGQQHRYHHLYHALWELRDPRQYLKEPKAISAGTRKPGWWRLATRSSSLSIFSRTPW